jgi:hypothetical protein
MEEGLWKRENKFIKKQCDFWRTGAGDMKGWKEIKGEPREDLSSIVKMYIVESNFRQHRRHE